MFMILLGVPFSLGAEGDNRPLQIGVTAGFNSLVSGDALVKKNQGAELGIVTSLPVSLWREEANLITVRGQFTNFSTGIDTAGANGDTVKLVNASHSQLRADCRQVFTYWSVGWSVGLGIQIPLTTNILTPRGEFNFSDAKNYYPGADAELAKIDRSFMGYLRLGIDQKLFSDALLVGGGLEIGFAETPKTSQRFALNFYAGARVW